MRAPSRRSIRGAITIEYVGIVAALGLLVLALVVSAPAWASSLVRATGCTVASVVGSDGEDDCDEGAAASASSGDETPSAVDSGRQAPSALEYERLVDQYRRARDSVVGSGDGPPPPRRVPGVWRYAAGKVVAADLQRDAEAAAVLRRSQAVFDGPLAGRLRRVLGAVRPERVRRQGPRPGDRPR